MRSNLIADSVGGVGSGSGIGVGSGSGGGVGCGGVALRFLIRRKSASLLSVIAVVRLIGFAEGASAYC